MAKHQEVRFQGSDFLYPTLGPEPPVLRPSELFPLPPTVEEIPNYTKPPVEEPPKQEVYTEPLVEDAVVQSPRRKRHHFFLIAISVFLIFRFSLDFINLASNHAPDSIPVSSVEPENVQDSEQKTTPIFELHQKAEQGDPQAQLELGNRYFDGISVPQNFKQAVHWYEKAAKQNNADAQFNLGYCYESGQGAEKNFSKAVHQYRRAAELGHAVAQCNLGRCYESGQGVCVNLDKAFYWYQKSAKQGYAIAQCNLGDCYYNGWGVAITFSQAASWYKKSAEQGYAVAQYNIALCYETGRGVEKNPQKAILWYEKAAEQNNKKAVDRLSLLRP